MLRPCHSALLLAPACCLAQGQDHLGIAHAIIGLLSETEACLNTCRDKESVQQALPRLKELAAQARRLKQAQADLPDSTVQDDIAVSALAKDFTLLWKAIGQHLERLEADGLMEGELRDILRVSPPTPQKEPAQGSSRQTPQPVKTR